MPVTRIFDAVMEFDLPNTVAWVQAEIDDGTDVSVIL
ncbi:MAG TPA: cobalamin-binding protein, partial [Thermodesulforhabdus norvegica]|nr:cobalamin-binding protein [Thermodesulforhabdus norvegica]